MARVGIDELNILGAESSNNSFDYHDFITHYYDPMNISESQRKKRIEAAEEIFDAILLFLIWCDNVPERVLEEDTLRSFENMYKEVIFQYSEPDDYFDIYVPIFINNLITVTLNHTGEEYFTSVERAANVAANESNTVINHKELEDAKLLGFKNKTWVAEIDDRTRKDHFEMDGWTIPIDDYFIFDDCVMLFPHDAVNGSARQTVNCRCAALYTK